MVLDQIECLAAGITVRSRAAREDALSQEQALDLILESIDQSASSHHDKDTCLAALALDYFRHEPTYRDLFTKVETYSEWARRHQQLSPQPSLHDSGIDLVATNTQLIISTNNMVVMDGIDYNSVKNSAASRPDAASAPGAGIATPLLATLSSPLSSSCSSSSVSSSAANATESFTAIQCKSFAPGHVLAKKDITAFLAAASSGAFFTQAYIMVLHDQWAEEVSKWAEEVRQELLGNLFSVQVITKSDLANSALDWSSYYQKLCHYAKQDLSAVDDSFNPHNGNNQSTAGESKHALLETEHQAEEHHFALTLGEGVLVTKPTQSQVEAIIAKTLDRQ